MSDIHFPILSGDFDSLELTENQKKLVDILKAFGKMSLIVSNSKAKFRTEKIGGLESFLYQLKKMQNDEPDKIDREEVERLELETRYEEQEKPVGNSTEILRVLLGNAHSNQQFTQLVNEVITEQLDLSRKRADIRALAESHQATDLGL
jgi:hypothetical protein